MTNNGKFQLIVVDDDPLIHDSIKLILPKNWSMHSFFSMSELPETGFYHAAFVDMHLTKNGPVAEGPLVIGKLRENYSWLEIFGMSGDLTMELMEKALNAGARRFLAKPLAGEEIKSVIDKAEALWVLRDLGNKVDEISWVGKTPESEKILFAVSALRGEKGPILIEGETGSGKEVVAHLLSHQEKGRPFVAVNIAAIAENLFESEIFGHVRGAFTGADSLKIGLAEAAHSGDLFLDEIEALPLNHQVKLLRFLENGEVRRVGAKEAIHVNARVIAASNQPLEDLVKAGKFREDLYFRLSGKRLQLPPLRNRKEDIALLCQKFLSAERLRNGKILSPEALLLLKSYNWPGNVRELKRICEQLLLTSPLPIIRPEDVESVLPKDQSQTQFELALEKGLSFLVETFEKQVLVKALAKAENDVDLAAEMIQISRSSFYKKMKDYQIEATS
jgi:DNA-binding NtrC family response regulator